MTNELNLFFTNNSKAQADLSEKLSAQLFDYKKVTTNHISIENKSLIDKLDGINKKMTSEIKTLKKMIWLILVIIAAYILMQLIRK